MRVFMFILFLVSFGLYLWASGVISKRMQRDTLKNKSFIAVQLYLLLNIGAIVLFLYLLTGIQNWVLGLSMLAITEASLLIGHALESLTLARLTPWNARTMWSGGEIGMKNPAKMIVVQVLSIAALVAYPVMAGVAYFSLSGDPLSRRILQYTLILFFLASYAITVFFSALTLASEHLDNKTRLVAFVNQFASLVPNLFWLALLFWSFSLFGDGVQVPIGSFTLSLSPWLLAGLFGVFLASAFIPFLIGAQRAKQVRVHFLDQRKELLTRLADILDSPESTAYLDRLDELQFHIKSQIDTLICSDTMIVKAVKFDRLGDVPKGLEPMFEAYRQSRNLDLRFRQLDALQELVDKVGDIRTDLARYTTDRALKNQARRWAEWLAPRRRELRGEIRKAESSRTPALAVASVVLMPILSALLAEAAEFLMKSLVSAPA